MRSQLANRRGLVTLTTALILLAGVTVASDQPSLRKSLYDLDDFYFAVFGDGRIAHAEAANIDIFRKSIQFEKAGDRVLVKVAITTTPAEPEAAGSALCQAGLQAVAQFGRIFTAKMPLAMLPAVEALAFVESIEPVAPEGYTARAAAAGSVVAADIEVKKK